MDAPLPLGARVHVAGAAGLRGVPRMGHGPTVRRRAHVVRAVAGHASDRGCGRAVGPLRERRDHVHFRPVRSVALAAERANLLAERPRPEPAPAVVGSHGRLGGIATVTVRATQLAVDARRDERDGGTHGFGAMGAVAVGAGRVRTRWPTRKRNDEQQRKRHRAWHARHKARRSTPSSRKPLGWGLGAGPPTAWHGTHVAVASDSWQLAHATRSRRAARPWLRGDVGSSQPGGWGLPRPAEPPMPEASWQSSQ
jgi:hypothetical protein